MEILKTTITGPVMGGLVAAVLAESVVLLTETAGIRGEIFLLSLAASVCSVFAHLAAGTRKHFREETIAVVDHRFAEFKQHLDRFEGRLDGYEANGLNTLISDRPPKVPTQPTPLKRVR